MAAELCDILVGIGQGALTVITMNNNILIFREET